MEILKGVYNYTANGTHRVAEPWSVIREDEGYWQVRADRLADTGFALRLRARITPPQKTYAFAISHEPDASPFASAEYRIENGRIRFRRSDDRDWHIIEETAGLFFPLMRLWTGPLVSKIVACRQQASILTPSIRKPTDRQQLFLPLHSARKAWPDTDNDRIVHYEGGEYTQAIAVEIDEHQLMHRYEWQPNDGSRWICALELGDTGGDRQASWTQLRHAMVD